MAKNKASEKRRRQRQRLEKKAGLPAGARGVGGNGGAAVRKPRQKHKDKRRNQPSRQRSSAKWKKEKFGHRQNMTSVKNFSKNVRCANVLSMLQITIK